MTSAITKNRDHLAQHRRLILGRAIAAGVAGSLPIPIVEEWITAAIKRNTIRRLAEARNVDIESKAVNTIADGANRPPEWAEIAGGRFILRLLSRSWRRVLIGVLTVRRLNATSRNFLVSLLFDHYCARLHVGGGLTEESGTELRKLIDHAIKTTPGGLNRRLFRRALLRAAKVSVRTPLELANWVTGGSVRKLLKRGDEVEAVEEVADVVDRELGKKKSFLSRAVSAAEFELAVPSNPYLHALVDRFETVWNDREDQKNRDHA